MYSTLFLSLLLLLPLSELCEVKMWSLPPRNASCVEANDWSATLTRWQSLQSASNTTAHVLKAPTQLALQFAAALRSQGHPYVTMCSSCICSQACDVCSAHGSVSPHSNMAAALAIVRHLAIRRVTLFFDDVTSRGEWGLPDFLQQLAEDNVTAVSLYVDKASGDNLANVRKQMRSFVTRTDVLLRHFIAVLSESSLQVVIDEAMQAAPAGGLLSRRFFWIVAGPVSDSNRFLARLPHNSNLLRLQVPPPGPDQTPTAFSKGLAKCSPCTLSCRERIPAAILNQTEIVATLTRSSGSDNHITTWVRVGFFSNTTGLQRLDKIFPNTFVNFGGQTLVIAVGRYVGFLLPTGKTFQYKNKTCNEMEGALINMTYILADNLNFRPCFVFSPDGLTGNYNMKTAKATGLVGMAARREVHMITYTLTPSFSRGQVIDFSFPFMNDPTAIIIRRQTSAPELFRVLAPLHWDSWLALSGTMIVLGLFIAFVSNVSPLGGINLPIKGSVSDEKKVKHHVWNLFGSILEQGQEVFPFAVSARIPSVAYWMFSLVLINTYTANFFSFLTVPNNQLPVKSLEDLSRQTTITPLLRPASFVMDLLANTKDPVGTKINSMLPPNDALPKSHSEALKMVKDPASGNWAYMGDMSKMLVEEAKNCKLFAVLPVTFNNGGLLSFAWPKNSFYEDKMNFLMQQMVEKGFTRRLLDYWFRKSVGPRCSKLTNTSNAFSAFAFDQLRGPLIILAIFIVLALLGTIFEILKKALWKTGRSHIQNNST